MKISFIIPTLNSAQLLNQCLSSILAQKVPLEIIVADGGSEDETVKIAQLYGCKIIHNPYRVAEQGKRLALEHATGKYVCFLDSDNTLVGENFISKAIEGLAEFQEEKFKPLGVESYYLPCEKMSGLCKYLTSILHISDPVTWMMSTRPLKYDSGLIERWRYCENSMAYPLGANGFIYRREDLMAAGAMDYFEDTKVAMKVCENLKSFYWLRIKGMGVNHHYVDGFWNFLKKRKRQTLYYMANKNSDSQSWIERNPAMSPLAACFYCATFFLPICQMIYQIYRTRNWLWLYHPAASFLSVLGIVWGVASYKFSNQAKSYSKNDHEPVYEPVLVHEPNI